MRTRLLVLWLVVLPLIAMSQVPVVTAGEVVWFDGQHPVTYSLPKRVEPVVKVALELFKSDLQQVTGLTPVASDKAVVKVVQGKVAPDGFRLYVKDGQIIIEGGNGRGMAYGLLELSRMAGVSPWIWWGDIVPERKERLLIDSDFSTAQAPSVAYRGIFINDEDWSTRPWSCKNFEPGPDGQIGPKTYRKIFGRLSSSCLVLRPSPTVVVSSSVLRIVNRCCAITWASGTWLSVGASTIRPTVRACNSTG